MTDITRKCLPWAHHWREQTAWRGTFKGRFICDRCGAEKWRRLAFGFMVRR